MNTLYRVTATLLALCSSGCAPSLQTDDGFVVHDVPLATYGLFDLGVVDADGDGLLDIFTSNHSGPQSLMLNRGGLAFEEAFSTWQLDQDHAFPGLAVMHEEVEPTDPALYVSWRGPDIVVRSHGLGSTTRIDGTIELYSPVDVTTSDNIEVHVNAESQEGGATLSSIEFNGTGDGFFALRPVVHSLPIRFRLRGLGADKVRVGPNRVQPKSTDFSMHLRDRHGMAWADYDADGQMDLFIARGGLRGTMGTVPLRFWEELYVRRGEQMVDIAETVGLENPGCPGREASWIDFDQDQRLDVYVVCGRGEDANEVFPNELFRQNADGSFTDVAREVGLDMPTVGKVVWVDANGDGPQDVLWASRENVVMYESVNGRFVSRTLHEYASPREVVGLVMGDADGDGDADALVVSPGGNTLLIKEQTSYVAKPPSALGLPARSVAANWVDVDNDGALELYSFPEGLFRRGVDGKYAATGKLRFVDERWSLSRAVDALSAWADFDGDGSRDMLLAVHLATKGGRTARWVARLLGEHEPQNGPLRGKWAVYLVTHAPSDNHWLQVDVEGPPHNRQASDARVEVTVAGVAHAQEVGFSESSRYSQGHYRLYFALGGATSPPKLKVTWGDGTSHEIPVGAVDRRIAVRFESPTATTALTSPPPQHRQDAELRLL